MMCNNNQTVSVDGEILHQKEVTSREESADKRDSTEKAFTKRCNKVKSASHSQGTKLHKSPRSTGNASREQCPDLDLKGKTEMN